MKRTPEKIHILRDLADEGATVSQAARALGISIPTAQGWAAAELIVFPTRVQASKRAWADPEVRARMSEARKRAWADPEVRARMNEARKRALADPEVRARIKAARAGAPGVVVPSWIPAGLEDEYLEVAADQDEFAAARHIRFLKREMERARG